MSASPTQSPAISKELQNIDFLNAPILAARLPNLGPPPAAVVCGARVHVKRGERDHLREIVAQAQAARADKKAALEALRARVLTERETVVRAAGKIQALREAATQLQAVPPPGAIAAADAAVA